LSEIHTRFQNAPEHIRATMISGLNHELHQLDKYGRIPQDPPEMNGRRTFGRGGTRIPTAAARTENELIENDRIQIPPRQGLNLKMLI